jgi:hypothetical protein
MVSATAEGSGMAVHGTELTASFANVAGAIRRAAQATGTSFDYLLATAKVESNLNPNVKATTSSATGLFQFIEQTWLATLKRAGPALGYGHYAKSIFQMPDGRYVVDPSLRGAVLDLRRDPATNAAMAGAFTQQNSTELHHRLGRPPTGGELYIAHFLGPAGAAKLIFHAANAPRTAAADLVPAGAAANRSIFYDDGGLPRSAGDVYRLLTGRFEAARLSTVNSAGRRLEQGRDAPVATPDPAGTLNAFAMVSAVPVAKAEAGPAFHSLFHTGQARPRPISPVVGALWGGGSAEGVAMPVSLRPTSVATADERRADRDLRRLYQNSRSNIRGLFDGTR